MSDTPGVPFSFGEPVELQFDPNKYLLSPIELASRTNTWETIQTNDPDGTVPRHVESPATDLPKEFDDATGGKATFTFDVQQAGNYYVWFRTKMLDQSQNEIYLSDGTTTFQNRPDTVETGFGWEWRQFESDVDTPIQVPLEAGEQTITLAEREGGVKLNFLALTTDTFPNMEQITTQHYDLRVDISDLVGLKAVMVVTFWKVEQDVIKEKIIGVKEMRLVSELPLRIKGFTPLSTVTMMRVTRLIPRSMGFSVIQRIGPNKSSIRGLG